MSRTGEPLKPVSRSVPPAKGPPPSHPDSRRSKPDARDTFDAGEGIARLQMLLALALGVVLVGGSLYVWRRPKPDAAEPAAVAALAAGAPRASAEPAAVAITKKEPIVLVGEPRVQSCQDLGPGKTDECGVAEPLGAALKKAIVDNEACLPPSEGAGSIEFVADFQFEKKRVTVTAPQSSRTVKSSRASVGCAAAVKRSLVAGGALALPHDHARVKVAAQASYAARAAQ